MCSLSSSMFVWRTAWGNWTKSQCSSSSSLEVVCAPSDGQTVVCVDFTARADDGDLAASSLFSTIVYSSSFSYSGTWRIRLWWYTDVEEDMDGGECGNCREREERYTHCLKLIIRLNFVCKRRITPISIYLSLWRLKVGVPPQTLTHE